MSMSVSTSIATSMSMSMLIVIINLSMSIPVPIPIQMSMPIQIATSMVMCMPMQNKIASPRADKRPGGMREAIRIILPKLKIFPWFCFLSFSCLGALAHLCFI